MRIFSVLFLVLVPTAFSQTTEQFTTVEQPSVPPAAERAYSERERSALCKKKQNAPLAPSEPQPLMVEGKVTRPKILRNVKPVYPTPPVDGTVILQVVIDEDGCVRDPTILRGVNRYQDSAALNAVRQWAFLPATLEGKPVSVNYVLTIHTATSVGAWRSKIVYLSRQYEADVLGPKAKDLANALVKWWTDVPDLSVNWCANLMVDEAPASKKLASAMAVQALLAAGVYVMEHAGQKVENQNVWVAGMEGVVRAYQNLLSRDSAKKDDFLEKLTELQRSGKLGEYVQAHSTSCK